MLIRPMDLQVLLPRAGEAARAQQTQEQQILQQPQAAGQQWQALSRVRQGQVQHSEAGEEAHIRQEQREQRERQQQEQGEAGEQHGDASQTAVVPPDPLRGHHIDIRT